MKLLLVKMSSLGDVVHTFPAITDAVAAVPGLEVHWAVEDAYVEIARLHPGVARVLPVGWRSARRSIGTALRAIGELRRTLRQTRYDLALDAQGLVKSAALIVMADARESVGFDWASAREPPASVVYRRHIVVARELHAVERVRQLFAGAFGYALPKARDFGLPISAARDGGLVLLHGTTWANKQWPEAFWGELAQLARGAGVGVTLPWGNDAERQRAERIANLAPGSIVAPPLSIADLVQRMKRARAIVSVDSGLGHLAAALGTPVVGLFGPTSVARTGLCGVRVANVASDFPCAPCLQRMCVYRGPAVLRGAVDVSPPCFSRTPPERIWAEVRQLAALD